MAPSSCAGGSPEGFYALATGFVGMEASIAYTDFVKRYERVISAEDVMEGRVDEARAKALEASEALSVVEKLVHHNSENTWKKKEAKNIAAFVKARGGEQLVYFWNPLSKGQVLANIQAIHKEIGNEVVSIVREARGLNS